ncbi:MAG: hypothetical protein ABI836_09225 [Gemmatimonadota bacterium]
MARMGRWAALIGTLASASGPRTLQAQAPVLELDHVYIVVPPGAASEAEALRRVGLVVDSEVARHDGEGTASIAAFFDNVYLELIWVDSSVAVDSAHQRDLGDFLRAAAWRESGASPFGVGLHFLSGTRADLGLPVRLDSAPHLGPGNYYVLLRQPAESLAADLFIMPPRQAVTSWLSRFKSSEPDLFAHPLGVHRITRVSLHGEPANRPRAADLDLRLVHFEPAESRYLEVEFDGGQQGQTWDLRPAIPLVLRR